MQPQIWNVPHGELENIAKALGLSVGTVGKCLKGRIKGIVSEDTARRIYAEAKLHHASRIYK